MSKNQKALDRNDADALFVLFQEVTGVDANTVVAGSFNIVEVDGAATVAIFDTIDLDDGEAPPREHIIQIVPGEPVQEEL